MIMDGKTIRLRASCNACNESKVRCSQHKPMCARCERNGTGGIYGLSRRTHRDAPSISTPPSQRPRRPSPSSSNSDNNSSSNTISPQQQNGAAAGSSQFHMYMPETPSAADPKDQLFDFSSLVTASSSPLTDPLTDPLGTAVTYFPTPGTEYANHYVVGPLDFGGNNNSDGRAVTDMETFWARQMATAGLTTVPPSPTYGECSCHAGVMELLVSMRGSGDDQRLSLDVQLAKLKRCIVSCETSMGCSHGREDAEPIHIMAVATLIGYVVDRFETLASESPLRRSSATAAGETAAVGNTERGGKSMSTMVATGANMSIRGFLEPRLSWGVLELEDDDEMDLRQRLFLLSFRKLERLLSLLTLYLRNLHDARASLPDPSRYMAFVMACDYTRLWLEKKAGDVKRLFLVSVGDETVDPALTQHFEL